MKLTSRRLRQRLGARGDYDSAVMLVLAGNAQAQPPMPSHFSSLDNGLNV